MVTPFIRRLSLNGELVSFKLFQNTVTVTGNKRPSIFHPFPKLMIDGRRIVYHEPISIIVITAQIAWLPTIVPSAFVTQGLALNLTLPLWLGSQLAILYMDNKRAATWLSSCLSLLLFVIVMAVFALIVSFMGAIFSDTFLYSDSPR